MQQFSLRTKFLSITIGIILVMSLAIIIMVHTNLKKHLTAEIQKRGEIIALDIADDSVNPLLTKNIYALQTIANDHTETHNEIDYIFITDTNGEVLVHTFDDSFPTAFRKLDLLKKYNDTIVISFQSEKGLYYHFIMPVLDGGAGVAHVGIIAEPIKQTVNKFIALIITIISFISFVGCILAIIFVNIITKPILKLTHIAELVGKGDLLQKADDIPGDEIGKLAISFNQMVDNLRDATEGLEQRVKERTFELNEEIVERKYAEEEKEKLQAHLQHAQKMEAIGTLAGGIAHDFNNLLGVITGNVSYSLSQLNPKNELFEVLSDVQEGTKQAQTLTQQLLTFAKGGEPVKKTADINQLIKEVAQFAIRGAKSRCEFKLSENLSMVDVDTGQINQVISNLVINANQAMPHGGIIQIRTEMVEAGPENNLILSAGRYIKMTIEDQGIGVSEKHLSNIFDPFFTTKQQGNGLGLSTVYSIIKKHSGHITVYSELEKGTVFHVYLPASLKGLAKTKDKLESAHQGQEKILILDDQESILKMVGRMLSKMGYETAFATDGSQAVEMYKKAQSFENPFDLVILDLTVPGSMGGLKTIIELLKIDPNVKAAVSSGYSNDPIMANYEDYGFCGVIPKPYTKAQLSEVLNNIF